MADFATPSAAKMSSLDAGATTPTGADAKQQVAKPEKPDEDTYKAAVEKAKKELTAAQEATKAAQAKVNLARPANKDSPTAQRQQELRTQLAEIKQKQQGLKTSRTSVQDKIKLLDTQLKSRINDQKTSKSKIPFKSVDEIDREIQRLEKQVDTGTMKLVDEKKTLSDITALRKQRKAFGGFEDSQKGIDDLKAQIAELRKSYDDPESKALSDSFAAAAKELDEIKAQQDTAFKGLNASRDDLTKARSNQDQKYAALKAIQDKYYNDKRAYHDYEREANRQRQVRQKAERDAYFQEKRRKDAAETLEKAATPAYLDEIRSARSLIQRLDPTFGSSTTSLPTSKFAATAQRTVDAGEIQGTRVMKKTGDEEDYFQGTGGKKGKKGKKLAVNAVSSPSSSKIDLGFFMTPGVISEMSALEIDTPSSQADIPSTIEKLKEKLKYMEDNQAKQTKENIASAQAKIDALEAEAASAPAQSSKKSAAESNGNRETDVTETSEKLANASLDESKDVVAESDETKKEADASEA